MTHLVLCKPSKDCSGKPDKAAILDALELSFKILAGEEEDPNKGAESADENPAMEEQPDSGDTATPDNTSPAESSSSSSSSSEEAIPAGSKDSKAKATKKKAAAKATSKDKKNSAKTKSSTKKAIEKEKAQESKKNSVKEKEMTNPEAKKKGKTGPKPIDTSNVVVPGFMRTVSSNAASHPIAEPAAKRARKK